MLFRSSQAMTKELETYVLAATQQRSIRAIAASIGMTHTTLSNHLRADVPYIETVLKVARHYDLELVPLFLAAGYITEAEAEQFRGPLSLSDISDLELSKEMLRRVAAGSATSAITAAPSEQLIDDVLREVEDARTSGKQSRWDLAADARDDITPGEYESDEPGPGL